MELFIFLGVGIVEAIILGVVMHFSVSKGRSSVRGYLVTLQKDTETKSEIQDRFKELYGTMIDIGSIRTKGDEYLSFQESLKAERGRITITQAELETVEGRLRELEEIERELEASGIETKEEINILEKKQTDLRGRNETLQGKISESTQKLEQVMTEIELTAQQQEQIDAMKGQLISTQEKIDTLITQCEEGNAQYFILKKRYDALDIEYAQLYEKFSAMEDGG